MPRRVYADPACHKGRESKLLIAMLFIMLVITRHLSSVSLIHRTSLLSTFIPARSHRNLIRQLFRILGAHSVEMVGNFGAELVSEVGRDLVDEVEVQFELQRNLVAANNVGTKILGFSDMLLRRERS